MFASHLISCGLWSIGMSMGCSVQWEAAGQRPITAKCGQEISSRKSTCTVHASLPSVCMQASHHNHVHVQTWSKRLRNLFWETVKNRQPPRIEPRASDLSRQCSTTWAMATGWQPALTILNITLYVLLGIDQYFLSITSPLHALYVWPNVYTSIHIYTYTYTHVHVYVYVCGHVKLFDSMEHVVHSVHCNMPVKHIHICMYTYYTLSYSVSSVDHLYTALFTLYYSHLHVSPDIRICMCVPVYSNIPVKHTVHNYFTSA